MWKQTGIFRYINYFNAKWNDEKIHYNPSEINKCAPVLRMFNANFTKKKTLQNVKGFGNIISCTKHGRKIGEYVAIFFPPRNTMRKTLPKSFVASDMRTYAVHEWNWKSKWSSEVISTKVIHIELYAWVKMWRKQRKKWTSVVYGLLIARLRECVVFQRSTQRFLIFICRYNFY